MLLGSERERDYRRGGEFRHEKDRRRGHHESHLKHEKFDEYNSCYKDRDRHTRSLSKDSNHSYKQDLSTSSLIKDSVGSFVISPQSSPPAGTLPLGQVCANNYSPLLSISPHVDASRAFDPRVTSQAKKVIEESKQNFRLLIDPAIKKGHMKVVRYDGVLAGVFFLFFFF